MKSTERILDDKSSFGNLQIYEKKMNDLEQKIKQKDTLLFEQGEYIKELENNI